MTGPEGLYAFCASIPINISQNDPQERLILRQFTEKDAGALFSLLSDKEVNTFLPMFPLRDIKEAEAYLRNRYITNRQDSEASITRSVSKKITSPSAMSTQAETIAMT